MTYDDPAPLMFRGSLDSGEQWRALCPAPRDADPQSFVVRAIESNRGTVTIPCGTDGVYEIGSNVLSAWLEYTTAHGKRYMGNIASNRVMAE